MVRPDLAEGYWRLAINLLGRLPDAEVQAMEALLQDQALSNDDRALLHFALASVMDRRELYSRAAVFHAAANLHQSASKAERAFSYDPDQHARYIDQIIACFNPEFLARGTGWGSSDARPIFVVGFARSGTTLTEQILAAHPRIHGAGELHDLHRLFQALPEVIGAPSASPFDALSLLGPASAQAAARRYLDRLDALAPTTADRVVDKMPDNVNYLGLIALLFPRAKVIMCRRDFRDIALSCWQTGFRPCPWNNDWDHIARRLADYQRILLHWREVQPIPWLDFQYEDVVVDIEHHARRLIEFVGLEWHPACLEFHSNRRVCARPATRRFATRSTPARSPGGDSMRRPFSRCFKPSSATASIWARSAVRLGEDLKKKRRRPKRSDATSMEQGHRESAWFNFRGSKVTGRSGERGRSPCSPGMTLGCVIRGLTPPARRCIHRSNWPKNRRGCELAG